MGYVLPYQLVLAGLLNQQFRESICCLKTTPVWFLSTEVFIDIAVLKVSES